MRKRFLLSLLVALLTTIATHAYSFQSGDLYYNITSDNTVEVTYQEQWNEFNYQGLTTATIPATVTKNGTTYSVTSIGDDAFYVCSSLTSITLPNSVTSIGRSAFGGCSSLTSITIPNSVTSIGRSAFSVCSSLTSITLPNSVTSIGNYAFDDCSALTSITLPNSVTSIGDGAFEDCSALTSITIGNSVTSIGRSAFYECSSLTSITLPNSVTSIGHSAFYGCSSLTSITIPNSVTSIEKYAFYRCSSLTSITIPNSVTSIGESAFSRCSSLTSIVVESGNTVYDSRENCNAIIETASNTLIAGCQSTTIPNSVTSIGSSVFTYCRSLTSLTLPNSVTSIGEWAFQYCSSLTSLTLPNSVTTIGSRAFWGCSSLTSITCLVTTPPTCGTDCFYDVPSTIPLYVPAESVEAYKAADTWKEFDVQALLSTDATLSSLTYNGMLVPSFNADTLYYTVDLPSETVDVPVVDAVANDLGAQITIHQATTLPSEASVEVIAADNTTRQTYTIYFSKKSTPTDISDRPDTTRTDSDKGAEKLLRNGQVLIIRNGKTYNMMGQRL